MIDNAYLKLKVSRYTIPMLHGAIADCHHTLKIGQYPYEHPYAQKLWAEIDACRDRLMALTKGKQKWKDIFTIQRAANAARARTGNDTIGVGVRAGQYQVQHITYTNGVSTVVPVTDWMPLSSVLPFLESMQ